MKTFLRPFTVWATDLTPKIFDSVFERARLRLTLLYASITLLIIAIFSGALYSSLEKNMATVIAHDLGRSKEAMEIFRASSHQLELLIIQIDIVLIFLVTGISYILAGRVLKPIKEAIESEERFMADASHDLRTPLAIMKTEIEVGLGDKNNYEKILYSNLEEINKMSVLVSNLLTLGRRTSERDEENFEIVELSAYLEEIVQRFESQLKVRDMNLEFVNEIIVNVKIDEFLFSRVIENVIQNAINYTAVGGKIIIKTAKHKKEIMISISDNGIGISENDLPKVFNRFYKAENSRKDSGGSGLGLAIAKKIVIQHKGSISINSKVNEGTNVMICLPCV